MNRRVIVCNHREGTKAIRPGALAYLVLSNGGSGHDRVQLLVRSRGGRWIRKWERTSRLTNFRAKTLPPSHPRYDDERVLTYDDEVLVARLNAATGTSGVSWPD